MKNLKVGLEPTMRMTRYVVRSWNEEPTRFPLFSQWGPNYAEPAG